MRRFAGAIVVLAAAAAALPGSAAAFVGAPLTHGPDPIAVARGPEPAAAPQGALGKRGAKLVPSSGGGHETSPADVLNEVDNGPFRYHAVYMIAADGADRLEKLATGM